jgi:hypothetical protein
MESISCSLLDSTFAETQEDFYASGTYKVQGASIEVRPDAISLDYHTAYTYGPTEQGSSDSGIVEKVWRASVKESNNTGSIYLARQTDDGTNWRNTASLFTYDATIPIDEIDLAFAADARAIISAQRKTGNPAILSGSEIWLYWFNPVQQQFVFEKIGVGKTPRVVMDSPSTPEDSDVLLFYVKNDVGHIYYRQQRDQYAIERWIPAPTPSSVSGTLMGSLSGTLSGSFTGSAIGSFRGILTGTFEGRIIGTGSGISTGSLYEVGTFAFTGSMDGTLTGSLSGSLLGFLNNNSYSGSGVISGSILGIMTGSISGACTGTIFRRRNYTFSGSFNGSVTGSATGTMEGTSTNVMLFDYLDGYMTGSLSGSMIGEVVGIPVGSQVPLFQIFLEDANKLRDGRVTFYYSLRNLLSGKYQVRRFDSVLYPIVSPTDRVIPTVQFLSSSLVEEVLIYGQIPFQQDDLKFKNISVQTGSMIDVVQVFDLRSTDSLQFNNISVVTSSLTNIVLIYSGSTAIVDSLAFKNIGIVTSSLSTVVISSTLSGSEHTFGNMSITVVSGSLG